MKNKVYLGADHRGFQLKEKVSQWLFNWGYEFEDMGAEKLDPIDDYTLYAERVASVIAKEKNSKGILICGSGVGVEVVANKFDGVRAGLAKTKKQVQSAREDDNMNILVLAADYTQATEAKEMVKTFLQTKFSKKERHQKRLQEIQRIEANN